MDWIAQMNAILDARGIRALAAQEVVGNPSVVLLVENQEATAYHNPEGVWRALTLLKEEADGEGVLQALAPHIMSVDEESQIEYQADGGYLWIG